MRAEFDALWRKPWVVIVLAALACILAIGLAVLAFRPTAPRENGRQSLLAVPRPTAPTARSRVDYGYLDQRARLLMTDRDMVGLAVGVVEGGRLRFIRGYGETRAGSGDPVKPDTVFRWASVSKGVAASLVVKLAEEGKLSLDAPISTMGTTLALPGDASRVTVADVLSHRLGLSHNAWDHRLEGGADPRTLRTAFATLPLTCPPATCYAYQNVGYDTASEIVERATGQSYDDVARERLFAPLGMANASVGRAGLEQAASWARPHRNGKREVAVEDAYYRIPAAGGVNSSIFDLVRWMQAQMGAAPDTLSPHVLSLLHTPRVATPPHSPRGAMDRALKDARYGLGWRIFNYAGHTLVGHRGSVDGYGSLILFDPALESGIVMLWNSNQYHAARLQLEFFDMLYGLPRTDWLDLKPTQPGR